jgi:hypothetical protein
MSSAGTERPTLASTWLAISGAAFTDELLAWPPDVFALTNVLLDRSEAFRFALSPPEGVRWPPSGEWSDAVVDAGREWSAWVEDREGSVPSLLAEEWSVALGCADLPLADLAEGRDWRLCAALLSLHAIADEACAGIGSATERADGRGAVYRARARELLARTGSLARIAPRRVRVLPKVRDATDRPARVLTLRVCAGGRTRGLVAQAADSSPWDRPAGGVRQLAVVAVAAAGPRVRLPPRGGIGAAARARPVRILRVCTLREA